MKTRNPALRRLGQCALSLLLLLGATAYAAQPTAFDNWAKTAKIGGAAIAVGMSAAEIDTMLDTLVSQHVTVVEADSDLSNYQSDAQFELELALMRQFADAAHKRGLRVVWYIPALEVITLNGKNIPNTMAKDHPDWVQVGLDGQTNVFYGGGGQVFWVETNAESAWMSPSSSGYRSYFFERIKKMVATGIDGIWADVPIYADFGSTKWSGMNPEAVARFESDTGYSAPTAEDWNDTSWRRWIHWRHEELARFLTDMTSEARSVNSEFTIIAETLPTDYNGGTIYGLDASFLKDVEGLTQVYEVDTMSNNVGMRNAQTDDWISFISALKYARGSTGDKPSWTFTYGKQADDAQQVMAQAMIAGNNPYELQVPEMATTVGDAFRSRMFNWSKFNAPYLFEADSTAKTGIFFSSPSRDYVDQFQGLGMFATTDDGGDDLWWASDAIDSVYQRNYLAEHRGVLKVLVNEHIPFNILVVPSQAELSQYQTVFLPNVEAISDTEAARLRTYVQQGGKLIVTGPNPTGMNQYGITRSNYALADLLGFNLGDTLPSQKVQSYGSGKTYYFADRLGKQYLTSGTTAARNTLASTVRANTSVNVTTNADDRVYVETSQLNQQAVLQFTNFIGVDGNFSVTPTNISVTYTVPNGEQVNTISLSNPDNTTPSRSNVAFTQSGSQVSFNIPLTQYALVLVSFNGAQNASTNHVPAAGDDSFRTDVDAPLTFTQNQLLANDGDLDGNSIAINYVYGSTGSVGTVSDLGGGSYRYTPPAGFTGTDTLRYILSDGVGGEDTGEISILVAAAPSIYAPASVNLSLGTEDGTELSLLGAIDGETYDINSVSSGGKKVIDWSVTTTISEDLSEIAALKVLHVGQYSLQNVSQQAYLYNYQNAAWELFDTATVGNENNYPVAITISDNIAAYVSSSKQMSFRIRAERATGNVQSWSDQLTFEVIPVVDDTPVTPNPTGAVSYPVSNGSIAIDGSLSDWSAVTSLGTDGNDVTAANAQADWLEGWMAHDDQKLYLAYRNEGAINLASWWAWGIYLDTDSSANSGFAINGALGADYLFNGWSLYRYTGSGSDWSWAAVAGGLESVAQGEYAEAGILRSALGNPESVRALFRADNTTFTGSYVVDNYPNADNGYFTYNLGANPVSPIIIEPVTNASTLSIDGNASDWASLQSFGIEANDITTANAEADIQQTWMAHDAANFYLAYRNDGPINTGTWWPWQVFLDTDLNGSSGFQAGNDVGAEYMLQGSAIYQYTGAGSNWAWQYVSGTSNAVNGDFAEFSVPRSAIGNPVELYALVKARNGIFTGNYDGSDDDTYPNLGAGRLNYRFGGAISNPVPFGVLSLDGNLSDWSSVTSFGRDGDDISVAGAQADWMETWMAHDSSTIYLAYENDGAINTANWWPWQVFIDTDNNPATGFSAGPGMGAEYVLEGANLQRYIGDGSSWSWEYVGGTSRGVSGNNAEISFARSSIGNPSVFRVMFRTINAAFTGSYAAEGFDYFPNNATSSADGYFSYRM